jgi:hypothetical protein
MKLADIVDLETSSCFIDVRREGLAAALGHDLRIEVTRHALNAEDGETVAAEFDATSLRVVGALDSEGRLKPGDLSAKDRATIEASIRDKVLESKRHPTVRFRAGRVTEQPGGYVVEGELELHGVRKALRVEVTERDGRLVGRTTLHQPAWGITPYRAMLGALRVQADVQVEVSAARRG